MRSSPGCGDSKNEGAYEMGAPESSGDDSGVVPGESSGDGTTDAPAADGDGGGCGCTTDPASPRWLWLAMFAGMPRRRRAA